MVQRANPLRRRAHLLLVKKPHSCGANIVVWLALHELESRQSWQGYGQNLADGGRGTVSEHHDSIGQQHRFIHVMRHYDDRASGFLDDRRKLVLQMRASE